MVGTAMKTRVQEIMSTREDQSTLKFSGLPKESGPPVHVRLSWRVLLSHSFLSTMFGCLLSVINQKLNVLLLFTCDFSAVCYFKFP